MEKEGNYAAIQTMDNYDITGLFLAGIKKRRHLATSTLFLLFYRRRCERSHCRQK
jgi:hypothetical protein